MRLPDAPPLAGRRAMRNYAGGAAAPSAMNVERIAWSLTVFAGLLAALLFLLSGFRGYALLVLLLAIAASVNLFAAAGSPETERSQ